MPTVNQSAQLLQFVVAGLMESVGDAERGAEADGRGGHLTLPALPKARIADRRVTMMHIHEGTPLAASSAQNPSHFNTQGYSDARTLG